MPTGYTAGVADGTITTFADFAMQCTRAFSALINMRDEPFDAEIPLVIEPDTYYRDQLEDAQKDRAQVESYTPEECARRALEDHERSVKHSREYIEEKRLTRERYEAFLERARVWQAPTPEHLHFKEFMISQLEESIKFDCTDYVPEVTPLKDAEEWRREYLADIDKDIAYYSEKWQDAVKRAEAATAWVNAVRETLKENETV